MRFGNPASTDQSSRVRWVGAAMRAGLLAGLAVFTGCSSAGQEVNVKPIGEAPPLTDAGPRIDRVPDSSEPVPATGDADTSGVPAELLAAARADLERRLAAANDPGPIRVLIAEAVTWSDGSIGCPKPGMNYTMALVPGYRVVFGVRVGVGAGAGAGAGAEERRYAYHAGRSGPLAYCENPGAPSAASSAI